MSAAYVHNFKLDAGITFEQLYELSSTDNTPVNLTGYNASAQIRKHKGSGTATSFTIGFPDRQQGKIKLSIPSWVTAKLKSGRYVYDVLLTNSAGGTKTIVIEGSITVKSNISAGCSFSLPSSAQRLCIAVVDENAGTQTFEGMYTKWETFRNTYPNRIFYLLQPTPIGCCGTDSALGTGFGSLVDNNTYTTLHCPNNFLDETTVNTGRLIGE